MQRLIFSFTLFLALAASLAACSAPGAPVLDLKGTSWQVIEINGEAVPASAEVTANFSPEGQVNGKAACNRYFADYTQNGSALTFGMVGMTKMMCAEEGLMETEAAFAQALATVARFEEAGDQLRLLAASGQVVLVLGQPQPAPALDKTSWQLIALNGESLPVGIEITLQFSDGQASGRAACNSFFAEYTQQGFDLTFGAVGGTEMYCEGLMDEESAVYAALAAVTSFELKDDTLTLRDAAGTALLVYGAPQPAASLAGTLWKVKWVGEREVPAALEMTMQFEDGRIAGKASCNNYFADYTQEGESLQFGMAGATMMYCEGEGIMDLETAFLKNLELVRSFRFELGRLVLLGENGEYLLVLEQ
jgi:heat shock protein HslJ